LSERYCHRCEIVCETTVVDDGRTSKHIRYSTLVFAALAFGDGERCARVAEGFTQSLIVNNEIATGSDVVLLGALRGGSSDPPMMAKALINHNRCMQAPVTLLLFYKTYESIAPRNRVPSTSEWILANEIQVIVENEAFLGSYSVAAIERHIDFLPWFRNLFQGASAFAKYLRFHSTHFRRWTLFSYDTASFRQLPESAFLTEVLADLEMTSETLRVCRYVHPADNTQLPCWEGDLVRVTLASAALHRLVRAEERTAAADIGTLANQNAFGILRSTNDGNRESYFEQYVAICRRPYVLDALIYYLEAGHHVVVDPFLPLSVLECSCLEQGCCGREDSTKLLRKLRKGQEKMLAKCFA
jgi:hypothetical protein